MKYFLVLFLFNCNLEKFFLFKHIFEFESKQNPKIIFEKKLKNEKLFLIQNGTSEILAIQENDLFFPKLKFQKTFLLQEIGSYSYSKEKLKWVSSSSENSSIIKNIQAGFFNTEYIFFEFLSNEPPMELFSVPMILKNNQIYFNGLNQFKENPELIKTNRIYSIFQNGEFLFYSGEDKFVYKIKL